MASFLDKCNGCRACELACSFHHSKTFQPSVSSVEVIPVDNGFEIELFEKAQNGRFACDVCLDSDEKSCVKYCNAEVRDSLRQFIEQNNR